MTDKPTAAALEAAGKFTGLPANLDPADFSDCVKLALAFDAFAAQPSADGLAERAKEHGKSLAAHAAGIAPFFTITQGQQDRYSMAYSIASSADVLDECAKALRTRQPADTVERVLAALDTVRAENAGNFERGGEAWEAYDQAARDCYSTITAMMEER